MGVDLVLEENILQQFLHCFVPNVNLLSLNAELGVVLAGSYQSGSDPVVHLVEGAVEVVFPKGDCVVFERGRAYHLVVY